jgi:hypothetical protein
MGMGGIRIGGLGIGMPGTGRGGYPRSGYPGGQSDGGSYDPPQVTLRWESAMPIRAAELKAHDNEITHEDHRVEFTAKMGRLQLDQSFFLDDMVLQGKREL